MSQEKEKLNVKIKGQEVLKSELANLKPGARVYKQQQNSNVYFLSDKENAFSQCKKTLDDLVSEYKAVESETPAEDGGENVDSQS